MAATSPFPKLIDLVRKFVEKHEGQWTHQDWEELVRDSRDLGYPFDEDECRRNLGNILEGAKYFYRLTPVAPAAKASAKKAPAKKAAAKQKP